MPLQYLKRNIKICLLSIISFGSQGKTCKTVDMGDGLHNQLTLEVEAKQNQDSKQNIYITVRLL